MITRVGMAPRAKGLTYEGFQEHWRSEHAGLAGELPGLRGYIQNHAVLEDGRPRLPYPGFDACSEISFDSLAAMDEAFASEHYLGAVTADEHSLIDKSRFGLLLTERRILLDGDPALDSVKLLTFLPVHPRSTREALDDLLAGPYREVVAEAGPQRHEQLLEIPGAHEGRLPPVCAAVDILWFASPDEALGFVNGEVGHRAGYALAGTAFGLERVLARPIRIV
jgi:uncharacterized protein (TIGR02118 family)